MWIDTTMSGFRFPQKGLPLKLTHFLNALIMEFLLETGINYEYYILKVQLA